MQLMFWKQVKSKDRLFVIRQLSLMISSGVPLASALVLATEQTENDFLKTTLRVITSDVESGRPLSAALSRYPKIFDSIAVAMVRSGEASGKLAEILEQLVVQTEKQLDFTAEVRNALLYPIFVVCVLIVALVIIMTYIIPKLSEVFKENSLPLPWTTRLLVSTSYAMVHYWYLFILGIVGLIWLVRLWLNTQSGREEVFWAENNIPGIKALIANASLVRFSSILSMLMKAGVPISDALTIVGASMNSPVWSAALSRVQTEVEHGVSLSAALARQQLVPKTLTEMITVGEQTGKVDSVLESMSNYYQNEASNAIKATTALIEPAILLLVAVAVGFVVVSVIMPIYQISSQI